MASLAAPPLSSDSDLQRFMRDLESQCMKVLQDKVAALERGETVLLLQQSLENEQKLLAAVDAHKLRATEAEQSRAALQEQLRATEERLEANSTDQQHMRNKLSSECDSMRRQRDAAVWELDQAKEDCAQLTLRHEKEKARLREDFASQMAAAERAFKDRLKEQEERAIAAEKAVAERGMELTALHERLAKAISANQDLISQVETQGDQLQLFSQDQNHQTTAIRRSEELDLIEGMMRDLLREMPKTIVDHSKQAAELLEAADTKRTDLSSSALSSETIGDPENLPLIVNRHAAVFLSASVATLLRECSSNLSREKQDNQQLKHRFDQITKRYEKCLSQLHETQEDAKQTTDALKATQATAAQERTVLVEAALSSLQHLRLHQTSSAAKCWQPKAGEKVTSLLPMPNLAMGHPSARAQGDSSSQGEEVFPPPPFGFSPDNAPLSLGRQTKPSPPSSKQRQVIEAYSGRRQVTEIFPSSPRKRTDGPSWNSNYPWGHDQRRPPNTAIGGRRPQPSLAQQAAGWLGSELIRASTSHSSDRPSARHRQASTLSPLSSLPARPPVPPTSPMLGPDTSLSPPRQRRESNDSISALLTDSMNAPKEHKGMLRLSSATAHPVPA